MNNELIDGFSKIGVLIPEILLPDTDVDLGTWAVVACDQYTSQPEYWIDVKKLVADNPSTLNIVLPELYLEEKDLDSRIKKVNDTMKRYLKEDIIVPKEQGFIYINRKTKNTTSRKGLIIGLDLEMYNFSKGSTTLIRATEGTVIERLPPRVRIRENAAIELPHIMVLIDDPNKTVIEPLEKIRKKLDKLYDFDLMMDSGHIKGYSVNDESLLSQILNALNNLANKEVFIKKYSLKHELPILLFAMGDGNHSLATAKALWEYKKKKLSTEQKKNHPARFALVELVNVHDSGLQFEPIHRVLFNYDNKIFDEMKKYFAYQGFSYKQLPDLKSCQLEIKKMKGHSIIFIVKDNYGIINISNPKFNLQVSTLQSFLDIYLKNFKDVKIDYIHGEDVVEKLSKDANGKNIGFLLPVMPKTELFKTVILDGVLPRKTFSMGEASEKRFYLEARSIQ